MSMSDWFKTVRSLPKWLWVEGCFILVGAGLSVFGLFTLFTLPVQAAMAYSECGNQAQSQTENGEIGVLNVSVTGAVRSPGLVKLPSESRWADALAAVGGLSDTADPQFLNVELNLAEKISDGDHLYVPFIADSSKSIRSSNTATSLGTSINTATQAELEALAGIGSKRAQDIIAGRPYRSIEELVNKEILTTAMLAKIKSELTL